MHKLVLLRHGESTWNLENRFTGWTDVDLSAEGRRGGARRRARLLKEGGYVFDVAHTSLLKRAIRTLWITLDGHGPHVDPGAQRPGGSTSATTARSRASTRRRPRRSSARSR